MYCFSLKTENVDIGKTTECEVITSLVINTTNEFVETTFTSNDIYFKPPRFTFDMPDNPLSVSKQGNLSLVLWMTPGNIKVGVSLFYIIIFLRALGKMFKSRF